MNEQNLKPYPVDPTLTSSCSFVMAKLRQYREQMIARDLSKEPMADIYQAIAYCHFMQARLHALGLITDHDMRDPYET